MSEILVPNKVSRNDLKKLANYIAESGMRSYAPILPLLLTLKGQPFSLKDFFPLEPMYECVDVPMKRILKCSRQVSKSVTIAAQGVLECACIPHFKIIYVTPLREQVERFSKEYMKPLLHDSPIKEILLGAGGVSDTVLHRSFVNGSTMYFTYAYLDADRVRGISADKLNLDEVQDMDIDHLPVLESCLSASKYELVQLSGTPKTMDNFIQVAWEDSSQAEWIIPCECGHYSICNIEHDLIGMIQPKGPTCTKCSRLLNPRAGFFYHMFKERAHVFPGYHIPQPIMPMHYENENKWYQLLQKQKRYSYAKFLNEILGESCDTGSKLVTLTELRAVADLPWSMNLGEALRHSGDYNMRTMGVDWGGGGGGQIRRKNNILAVDNGSPSFTVIAITGFKRGSVEPHVLYAERLPSNMDPVDEVKRVIYLFNQFKCSVLGHDYGGAGNLRETMLIQAGFPAQYLMPLLYVFSKARPIVSYKPPTADQTRAFYAIDKTRSISLLCGVVKSKNIHMPQWTVDDEGVCLYEDFLSLVEGYVDRDLGPAEYKIVRNPKKPDDFVHALNFATSAYWHVNKMYPSLAAKFNISMGSDDPVLDDG